MKGADMRQAFTPTARRMLGIVVVAVSWGTADAGPAQDPFPLLQPETIRAAYEADRAGWRPAPGLVLDAFVAGEDLTFHSRAASRSVVTLQVAKRRLDARAGRLQVSAMAIAVGRALSHGEILDWYIHDVYLGQGCRGVDGAASAYFGKRVEALALHEAASLAALAAAPTSFHPVRAPDRAGTGAAMSCA